MQMFCRYAHHNRVQRFPSQLLQLPQLQEMYVSLLYFGAIATQNYHHNLHHIAMKK